MKRDKPFRIEIRAPGAAEDPEPVTITWLFFDKSRSPTCFIIKIPHPLFNQSSQNCEHFFPGASKRARLSSESNLAFVSLSCLSENMWPKAQIPVDTFDEREWPEAFTKTENIVKMIQGA